MRATGGGHWRWFDQDDPTGLGADHTHKPALWVHFGYPQALAFDTPISISTWVLAASWHSRAWVLQKEGGAAGGTQPRSSSVHSLSKLKVELLRLHATIE